MVDKDFDRIIAEYYREMELDIIASMKRNLSLHLKEEGDYEFDFPQWQAIKFKELKRYQRQNGRIVAGVSNRVSKEVSKHILEELSQGSKKEMRRFKEIMGGKYESSVTMKDSFFKINDRKVNSLISALSGDLHKANSAALRMANDTYRDVIFKASFFAANGVKTPKQAVDMAMRDFLSRGINCIEYKDGRRVNIASYARMAVRTASQRAYLIGEGSRRQAEGVPFVKITRHNTACELCRPFEGKILIDDVYSGGKPSDGDYMLMSTAMGAGLFHPNCRHGCSTHYPELDDFEYGEIVNQEVNDYGEYNRHHIDNMVQKYKRLLNGSLDNENIAKYEKKLREWEEKQKVSSLLQTDDYIDDMEKTKQIIRSFSTDKEMFERYRNVLKGIAPKTLEEFIEMKYNKPKEWELLKKQYRIVNSYKLDSGSISAEKLLWLDNTVIAEKRNFFVSKFKKSGNIAGAYLDENTDVMYYAHSLIDDNTKGYKGSQNLVLLKEKRVYTYIDVNLSNGSLRKETFLDTEAKLFEYFTDLYKESPFKSVTMLSERGMCDSCKNVMNQFKKMYPNVEVNVVSNKKTEGNVWKYRRRSK